MCVNANAVFYMYTVNILYMVNVYMYISYLSMNTHTEGIVWICMDTQDHYSSICIVCLY